MCVDAFLGAVKCRSALDSIVARSERDIIERDKFPLRGSFGTVKKLGDNKGEKIYYFAFLPFWCETFIFLFTLPI